MRSSDEQVADWRDADAYAPLLEAGRSAFAWEWLRRDPAYRDAAAGRSRAAPCDDGLVWEDGDQEAARWGLHAFAAPERSAIEARPVWRRDIYPYVLSVRASDEGAPEDRFDLGRLAGSATLVGHPKGGEHLLVSDGLRDIRIDVLEGTIKAGPVLLRYDLSGMERVAEPLLVLRRFLALWRGGLFSPRLHPRQARASRWILVLRARDALASGANQKEIAEVLLARSAAAPRWRVEAPELRSRVQRLVREARRMTVGGYSSLLKGR